MMRSYFPPALRNTAAFFARNACAELLASKRLAIRLESRGRVEDNGDGDWVLIIHADVQKAAVAGDSVLRSRAGDIRAGGQSSR